MKSTMLSGKTALVTGSTSGIGLGIARALAEQGANIVFNGFGDAQADREAAHRHRPGIRREDRLPQRRHVASRTEIEAMMRSRPTSSAASTSSSTTPASSTWRTSRTSRSRNGMRSSPST